MKLKMLTLLLFFLAMGSFVSSKQTADKNKTACNFQCFSEEKNPTGSNDKKKEKTISSPFAMAPGSYIFYY